MTAPTQTPPAPAPAAPDKRVMHRPFKIGVQSIDDEPYDVSVTLNTNVQTLTPQYEVPSTGYLNGIYIIAENVVTAETATATSTSTGVGVMLEDGPWIAIQNITFTDTNNSEIVGPISGWDLYVINKYGGYWFQDDPKANTDLFGVTANSTASSSAAGSFKFCLRIPVELVPRDALGSLPNKSSSTPFKVKTQISPIASIYANSATLGGSLRIRMLPDSYWEPTATDGSGNPIADQPPGVNTTQYWNVTEYVVVAGQNSLLLTNSVGFPIRNLGFLDRATTGGRATGESNFPDPFKLQLQSNMVLDRPKPYWKKKITEQYGYGGAGDTVGLKDNGLYWHPFCGDFAFGKPGWETRRSYLRTTDGMRLQAKGSFGAAGKLVVYTNYVGVGQGSSLAALTT